MRKYNLGFITDKDLFNHVKDIIKKYRFHIDLARFNKNIPDPIKLTFDSKVYRKSIRDVIRDESFRQIDKSNTNHIGYFHQNIFKYIGGDWTVPIHGFDIINKNKKIYVEMKNKHNTMNSTSSPGTYAKMERQIKDHPGSTCMLVEVIATKSQNIPWEVKIGKEKKSNENIRRVSIDQFYKIVTGDNTAFKKLCVTLPIVMDDVIKEMRLTGIKNTVLTELLNLSDNVLRNIYLSSFGKYEGFDSFNLDEN
ncbi:MAG TPA: Eco47II family restriction endonuclease [Coxiellaceae bacterium]|nr:MAG: restriction endonuclease [Gammaproteobacteria bacterium RIFCSPHIGHO2_12_FULL_36_30]HLB57063.1 Eco47II family restriction endonuclease [Coxiellaceae bacterium]